MVSLAACSDPDPMAWVGVARHGGIHAARTAPRARGRPARVVPWPCLLVGAAAAGVHVRRTECSTNKTAFRARAHSRMSRTATNFTSETPDAWRTECVCASGSCVRSRQPKIPRAA